MTNTIQISCNIEAQTETRVSPFTGDFASFDIEGWQGSVTIYQTNNPQSLMRWDCEHCETQKDVAEFHVLVLEGIIKDCQEMINKLTQTPKEL